MFLKKEILILFFIAVAGTFGKRSRVAGGSRASINDYSHIVSFRNLFNRHFCSGSIISRWHVVSAAHCFMEYSTTVHRIKAFLGTSSSSSVSGSIHDVQSIVNHHKFTWNASYFESPHDICIVKLKRGIIFSETQNKISLATRDIFDGNLGIMIGWGNSRLDKTVISENLLKAPITLFDWQTCNEKSSFRVHDDQFCSYHLWTNEECLRDVGACVVDSGGSVTSNGELYGIISRPREGILGLYDLHTKIYSHLDFIRAIVGKALDS